MEQKRYRPRFQDEQENSSDEDMEEQSRTRRNQRVPVVELTRLSGPEHYLLDTETLDSFGDLSLEEDDLPSDTKLIVEERENVCIQLVSFE